MIMRKLALLVGLGLFAASPLHARCEARFETLTETSGVVNLDPFDTSPFERTLRVTVRNTGSDPCRLGLSATDLALGQRLLAGTNVAYDLIWENLPIPNYDTPVPGRQLQIAANNTSEFFISVQVRRPIKAQPRPTEAVFTLRLHDLDRGDDVIAQQDARLAANIVAVAQINIAGSSSSFGTSYGIDTIDFGNLETGKRQTVYVQLRGNSSMRMTMESANAGLLRHETLTNAPGISYNVDILGQNFVPTTRRQFNGLLSTGLYGTNIPMTLVIGQVEAAPAGRYSDVLTLSIEPE
jgi:hypothetical protein